MRCFAAVAVGLASIIETAALSQNDVLHYGAFIVSSPSRRTCVRKNNMKVRTCMQNIQNQNVAQANDTTIKDVKKELRTTAQTILSKSGNNDEDTSFAAKGYSSGSSGNKDFYEVLSFAAAAVGQSHLSLLFQGIANAEVAILNLDKHHNVLPQEVKRFASTLESVKETLDCTMEECNIDGNGIFSDDSVDGENKNVPPQVLEIAQLISEGEDFIRSLQESEDQGLITVITNQLLVGNDCPCSKLSQLTVKIREAESKLQLYKTIQIVRQENEEQMEQVQCQMEELKKSMQQLAEAKITAEEETEEAAKIHEVLVPAKGKNRSMRQKLFNLLGAPARLVRGTFRGNQYKLTTQQFDNLKDTRVINELFDYGNEDKASYTPGLIQDIEDSAYPLRVETPIPANEAKRLRVLRDLSLVQLEMEGQPVGKGFEYHRNELIRTVVKLLRDTLPECEPFALQVVGDQESYTLTGEHTPAPVTPRSQVPCQHVMCLSTSDQAKLKGSIDGYTSDNVLAINLRGKHDKLTQNFCYTADTLSYIGAAIRINDVTIGSLCQASKKELVRELNWNKRKSAFVRKVATVLEEQLARLCVDWTLYDGELPEDWGILNLDRILAEIHDEVE
mmetsp:Transcript_25950/g.39854  ORF Transcript_25950/g.39854 Transcript_25950/m.39854 type:complete len:618 (-) Transcript_25950:1365-3218(-)|eukprot:CAMPEP_0195285070 /NCGR_PEP_ID=MMETSP0707-20130614/3034_1 /TAXON_ID=33640 /ORGANISM="Asterionellopsis glacialis, Strain CCMP134" /LENGTH=617 /DNA_ID=CAMNT_0040344501 /DNA_START=60 /DNA_END=1913 /DNA_ORIENTATION=+